MKNVLVISPVPFAPDYEGNRKRVRQIIDLFMSAGFTVDFLNVLHDSGDIAMMSSILNGKIYTLKDRKRSAWYRSWKIRHRISKLFRKYEWFNISGDAWFFEEINQEVVTKHKLKNYDVITCEYPIYSKIFENSELKNVLKIIDTHDVFADRYKIFLKNGQRPQWFSTSKEDEQKLLKRADLVLAIQDHEKNYFTYEYGVTAITFPFLENPPKNEYIDKLRESASSSRSLNVVFIGSKNQINLVAANWIIDNLITPEILRAGVTFHFIGSICSLITQTDGIITHGIVDNLDDIFADMDVLVNFLHSGSGLPIKVISCLSRGVLILANSNGIRGVDNNLKSHGVYLAETTEDSISILIQLASVSSTNRYCSRMKTAEIYANHFTNINKSLISTIKQFK